MYFYDNISLISRRTRNVSDESRTKSHNTYFIFISAIHEICAVFEQLLKNMVEPDRPEMAM